MMFFFVVGFCAVLVTISLMEYLSAKKRLVNQQLEQIITRKLMNHKDRQTVEILNLREACGVMRNLLIDIAENEAVLDTIDERTPPDVRTRIVSGSVVRRTELRAEVEAVLQSSTRLASVDASL